MLPLVTVRTTGPAGVVETTAVVVVDVGVDVDVVVEQDASNIAATINRLNPNHIIVFFNLFLPFSYNKYFSRLMKLIIISIWRLLIMEAPLWLLM